MRQSKQCRSDGLVMFFFLVGSLAKNKERALTLVYYYHQNPSDNFPVFFFFSHGLLYHRLRLVAYDAWVVLRVHTTMPSLFFFSFSLTKSHEEVTKSDTMWRQVGFVFFFFLSKKLIAVSLLFHTCGNMFCSFFVLFFFLPPSGPVINTGPPFDHEPCRRREQNKRQSVEHTHTHTRKG